MHACACTHTHTTFFKSAFKHWKEPETCSCILENVDLLCALVNSAFSLFCSFKHQDFINIFRHYYIDSCLNEVVCPC